MSVINIKNLNIKLKGVPVKKARQESNGLGQLLLNQLSKYPEVVNSNSGAMELGDIHLNSIQLSRNLGTLDWQEACIKQISHSIVSQIRNRQSRG